MISTEQWVVRVLRPRTMFGRFLHFLVAAVCLLFTMGAGILFFSEFLGLGKPRASVTTVLFWGCLFVLWQKLIPGQRKLKAFRTAEEAKERARRIAILEQPAASGDAGAAAALGEIYRSGNGSEQDLQRALRYFDIAAVELASAKRKAAAIREEMAQAEANRLRSELEAKEPDTLDATCPNCKALLCISSVKCGQCGALFFVSEGGWRPIAITPPTPSHSRASSIPSQTTTFAVLGAESHRHQDGPRLAPPAPNSPDQSHRCCNMNEIEDLRTGRNIMVVVVVLYALVVMLGFGVAAEVLALATVALGMFAAVRISEGLGYSSMNKVVSVVAMAIPFLGFVAVLGLVFKANRRLKQLR